MFSIYVWFCCWFSFLIISREDGQGECVKGITYKQAELKEDLHKLHDALLQELGYAMPVLHTGEFHREVDPHPPWSMK